MCSTRVRSDFCVSQLISSDALCVQGCRKGVLPVGVQKIRARSENSQLAWGYPPFLDRSTKGRSGVARETRGRRAGRVPESGRTDQGDSRRGKDPSAESAICAESPAGAES